MSASTEKLAAERGRLEEQLLAEIAVFNENDPQTLLEAIRNIRELRGKLEEAT